MFRRKTRGQVIGAELQEGFSHLGNALAEAGRLTADELGPRVEAAREAAGPALEAAQKAVELKVAPKVATAVAAAAPTVLSAREALAPRVEAAREVVAPRVEAALEAAAPRVSTAVTAAQAAAVKAAADLAPRVEAAQKAAQAAAVKAAADLAPRVEAAQKAAQKALADDVAPRLTAAQTAALAYAAPRVAAARHAVNPALESAREALEALEARRDELAVSTGQLSKKAQKSRAQQREHARKERTARAARTAKRQARAESGSRRWPWLIAVLGVVAVVSVVLRRKKGNDDLWPASSGDGPVPSYREDPVPSSPSDSGKTVSAAQTSPGDATPPDTDLGMQPQQMASTEDKDRNADVPGTATGGTSHAAPDDTLNTMINGPAAAKEGPGGVRPESDATNDDDEAIGPGGTPLADRGQEPGDERS